MTDDLERLKSAMAAGEAPADPEARKRAIAGAMAAYGEEFAPGSQGSLAAMRPNPEAASFWRRMFGRRTMRKRSSGFSYRTVLLGGAATATALIAVFTLDTLVNDLDMSLGGTRYRDAEQVASRASVAPAPAPSKRLVAVAARDLRFGDRIGIDSVRLVEYPDGAAPAGAFHSVEDLFRGENAPARSAVDRIDANEPILDYKVTEFGEEANVAALVRPGMRAYTLAVDAASSFAGFLYPGSRVDIYLTYNGPSGQRTKLFMESAEIIAVNQVTERKDIKAQAARTVTLEVTPEDSQRLILSERVGQLAFNLRGFSDEAQVVASADGDLSERELLGLEVAEAPEDVVRDRRLASRSGFIRNSVEVDKNAGEGRRAEVLSDADRLAKQGRTREMLAVPAEPEANRGPRARSDEMAAATQPAPLGVIAEMRDMRGAAQILPEHRPPVVEGGRERHPDYAENPVKSTAAEPVSTFSIDVDTASYAFVRSSLMAGHMPDPAAVRIEELVNYFPYDYQPPEDAATPFRAHVEVFPSPWKPTNRLVHIGIKGYEIGVEDRPKANLVFLIDTSGSMAAENKLPLLLRSFRLMLTSLDPEDTVSIVTYAGSAGVVLEPTRAGERRKIFAALDRLHSGGSTAGGAGLELAYALAEENFDAEGVNRVILATDGDFNVGISDPEQLKKFVEKKRGTGVGLSVLGFGHGNYNDTLMQTLAQNGDGNAAYIDTLAEAQKVMVEETSSTLFTIARDVKIQVEWNPATVSEYRLIGYETRALKREDFNNDKVDAGEIGAGHTVTAIYEITPAGAPGSVDPLRYASDAAEPVAVGPEGEYGFLKMRYKLPDGDVSRLIERPITKQEVLGELRAASTEAQFATAVAGFGQLLRGGAQMGAFGFDDVVALSQSGRGADPFGYRAEFTRLVRLAETVAGRGGVAPKR